MIQISLGYIYTGCSYILLLPFDISSTRIFRSIAIFIRHQYFIKMKLHLIINHAFIILFGIITNLSSAPVVCAKKEIAPRVMTIWWGFFNKPSECKFPWELRELECGFKDGVEMAETGQTYADLSILYGGGKGLKCTKCLYYDK